MQHLHPITEAAFWGQPYFGKVPASIYWKIGDQGMLARNFHMHPLLVDPATVPDSYFGRKQMATIDDDLLLSMGCGVDDIHIVTDSDSVLLFELSDETKLTGLTNRKKFATREDVVRWARKWTNPLHRKLVQHTVVFRGGELEPRTFAEVCAEADNLIKMVLDKVGKPTVRTLLSSFERTTRHFVRKHLRLQTMGGRAGK